MECIQCLTYHPITSSVSQDVECCSYKTAMAFFSSTKLYALIVGIAQLYFTVATSCAADNVLRAFRAQSEIGVLDCLYLFSIPPSQWEIRHIITEVCPPSLPTIPTSQSTQDDILHGDILIEDKNREESNYVSFLFWN